MELFDDRNLAQVYRLFNALNFCPSKQKGGEYDNQSGSSQIRSNLADVHSISLITVFEETLNPLDHPVKVV